MLKQIDGPDGGAVITVPKVSSDFSAGYKRVVVVVHLPVTSALVEQGGFGLRDLRPSRKGRADFSDFVFQFEILFLPESPLAERSAPGFKV